MHETENLGATLRFALIVGCVSIFGVVGRFS